MKPRILYLLPYLSVAGTEIHVIELAKSLKDDYNILIVAPYGKGITLLKESDIPYREIISLTFLNVNRYKKELRRIIEEFNPSIIHVHGAHELVYISKKMADKVPVIFTCHGYFTSLPIIDYRISAFINKRWGDSVIAVSKNDRDKLIKAGLSREKITTIHNGIPEVLNRMELPIKIDGFIIGTAARLTKFKGIRYLIEAFSHLHNKYKDLNLVVIGDGEERENLEKLTQNLNIEDRVFFLGALPNARLYFSNFHIFVLPSLFEALPIVVLEAMSQKVPVIATEVGGIPEIIDDGKTGILVPPEDPLEIARAIEKLINNRELMKELGEAGYKRYKEMFTLENMVMSTKNVYESLLTNLD
ncbi:MAG: glycosyltransferase family 4 protein [bacterium]|nr:glycosyltransferase family 4 protein [bacterium]